MSDNWGPIIVSQDGQPVGMVGGDPEPLPSPPSPTAQVMILYTNWQGETAWRRVLPLAVRWSCSQWHPEPQWVLDATDMDKQAARGFAMKDIKRWVPLETWLQLTDSERAALTQ